MRKRSALLSVPPLLTVSLAVVLLTACSRSGGDAGADSTSVATLSTGRVTVAAPAAMSAPVPAMGRSRSMGAPDAALASRLDEVATADGERSAVRELTANASLGAPDPAGAMLVRHGQASVEVKHVDDAVTRVRLVAAQYGGFVANASLRAGKDEQRAATLEIRVPTGQFDALVAALGGLGRVESVSATAQDVADEYVDLGARAANARRVEARLAEMLATRTGKLSDVLTVEQEITRVREQIERYEARLNWLERRTAMSSLDVALHEAIPLIDRQPGPGPLAEAFAEAWNRAVGVLAWCIASLGLLIPIALLVLLAVWFARRVRRVAPPSGVPGA